MHDKELEQAKDADLKASNNMHLIDFIACNLIWTFSSLHKNNIKLKYMIFQYLPRTFHRKTTFFFINLLNEPFSILEIQGIV